MGCSSCRAPPPSDGLPKRHGWTNAPRRRSIHVGRAQRLGDFTVDIALYDRVHGQNLPMADMLSAGIINHWKEPFREGVVYYLKDGRVRGVLLWNTWAQVDAARALIPEPGPVAGQALKGRLPR